MSLYTVAEFNTFITMLGCFCATVQAYTGVYASVIKKKTSLIKTNDVLFKNHRAFGSFAVTLYLLGLFAGLSGLIGALTINNPPLEVEKSDFNVHTWGSFPVMVVVLWKYYISYFKKGSVYKKGKWLGISTFIAWAFTWITAAISYYNRTLPDNAQHPIPRILIPDYNLLWLQILIPFIAASIVGMIILKKADVIERKKEERRLAKKAKSNEK